MKRLLATVTLLSAVCIAAACSSKDPDRPTAADATWSTWPGTITFGDSNVGTDMTWVIKLQHNKGEGSFRFTPPGGTEQAVEMKKTNWDGSVLGFSWQNADSPELACRLLREGDSLAGDCYDPNGVKAAHMTMTPPPGRLDQS